MKKLLFIGFLAGVLLKLFVFDFLTISGPSMEPALHSGKKILINKAAFGIHKPFSSDYIMRWGKIRKNDIVIFLHDNKIVIKRCVLTGGDSIEILEDSEYYLLISDLYKKVRLSGEQYEKFRNISSVPDDFIFVLGDNFSQSVDSRNYGFVSVKDITGKAIIHE